MIPTMMLVGLLVGLLPRPWYLVGVVVASIGWALALVVTDVIGVGDVAGIVGAVLLALVNMLVGVGVARAVTMLVRTLARQS